MTVSLIVLGCLSAATAGMDRRRFVLAIVDECGGEREQGKGAQNARRRLYTPPTRRRRMTWRWLSVENFDENGYAETDWKIACSPASSMPPVLSNKDVLKSDDQ